MVGSYTLPFDCMRLVLYEMPAQALSSASSSSSSSSFFSFGSSGRAEPEPAAAAPPPPTEAPPPPLAVGATATVAKKAKARSACDLASSAVGTFPAGRLVQVLELRSGGGGAQRALVRSLGAAGERGGEAGGEGEQRLRRPAAAEGQGNELQGWVSASLLVPSPPPGLAPLAAASRSGGPNAGPNAGPNLGPNPGSGSGPNHGDDPASVSGAFGATDGRAYAFSCVFTRL